MAPILFDTSVYIGALRRAGDADLLFRRWVGESPLWLSSVVLEELYAGASPKDHAVLEKLERDFDRARRILIPSLSDWTLAGKVLARIGQKYGYDKIGRGRLTNDALLAISAGRVGITLITLNARDFERLAEFRPFIWQTADINRF